VNFPLALYSEPLLSAPALWLSFAAHLLLAGGYLWAQRGSYLENTAGEVAEGAYVFLIGWPHAPLGIKGAFSKMRYKIFRNCS